MHKAFNELKNTLATTAQAVYGNHLVSLAIFGSWARGTATAHSDMDLLVIADPLPNGRFKRREQFAPVEIALRPSLGGLWTDPQPAPEFSPVFKTPAEVAHGSPLFLDMTEWCDLLVDRDRFFATYLDGLRTRMQRNGTRRVLLEGGYYWDYKPEAQPGEVITL